jgi:hemolysin activation/secretion protein
MATDVRHILLCGALFLLLAAVPAPALAQVVLPTPVEPRAPARPLNVPEAELELSIPAQPRAPDRRAVDELSFRVERIVVEGATIYSEANLAAFTAPLIGRTVGLSAIAAAAEAIENRYRADGYVLSRAFVPPQRVGDGTFRIQVVEGYLAEIVFEGGSEPARDRIRAYLRRAFEGRPANVAAIERGLLLAGDLAGVSAAGTLAPGSEPGSSNLAVRIVERPMQVSVSTTNRASKFQGPVTVTGEVAYNGILGLNEQIAVGGTTVPSPLNSKELRQGTLRYSQPVGDDGLTAGFDSSYSRGWPGRTLRALQVRTSSLRFGPRVSYPILRSRRENLLVDGSAYFARTETVVRGDPLTEDRYTALDARATYSHVGFMQGATVVSAGVTRGLTAWGNANSGDLPRSRSEAQTSFTKFTGEIRRIQLLGAGFTAQWTLAGQASGNKLYAGEEFSLGGSRFGRGYEPSEVTGIGGAGSSFELRYGDAAADGWQPYAFHDIGFASRARTGGAERAQSLASAGLGARFAPTEWLTAALEVARPLTRAGSLDERERPWKVFFDLSARF